MTDKCWVPPHPIINEGVDEILHGAFDLHVHAFPDIRPRYMDIVQLVKSYQESGFAGALLKDHSFPSVGRSFALNKLLPNFRCLSSCVLNASIGGLNPAAVEAAIKQGVDVVFMPTLSAAHHISYSGASKASLLLSSGKGLSIFNEEGKVQKEVYEILDLIADNDVILTSGHISPAEISALMKLAVDRKVQKRYVTHVSIDFINLPVELQRDLTHQGTYVEHCYVSCLTHNPTSLESISCQIKSIDSSLCLLSSDLGQPNNPSPVDGMKYFIGGLLALGIDSKELKNMVNTNPRSLILERFNR